MMLSQDYHRGSTARWFSLASPISQANRSSQIEASGKVYAIKPTFAGKGVRSCPLRSHHCNGGPYLCRVASPGEGPADTGSSRRSRASAKADRLTARGLVPP